MPSNYNKSVTKGEYMSQNLEARLREAIIDVPDFPKPGIIFKDITPILHDPELRADTIATFGEHYAESGVTAVAGPESRGFIFGVLLAEHLGVPFVPIRKPGKLPREVFRQEYDLEYGSDELQIHKDALGADDKVAIIDDLLATGGTAEAACHLVEQSGAEVVGSSFVIELAELEGRKKLGQHIVHSLVQY